MAELKVGGATITVAPYMFRELRQAAPYIERVRALEKEAPAFDASDPNAEAPEGMMVWMTKVVHEAMLFICIGIRRAVLNKQLSEPAITFDRQAIFEVQLEEICDQVEGLMVFGQTDAVQAVMERIMVESGLKQESAARPTGTGEAAGASPDNSTTLSPNLSPPGSAERTGTE